MIRLWAWMVPVLAEPIRAQTVALLFATVSTVRVCVALRVNLFLDTKMWKSSKLKISMHTSQGERRPPGGFSSPRRGSLLAPRRRWPTKKFFEEHPGRIRTAPQGRETFIYLYLRRLHLCLEFILKPLSLSPRPHISSLVLRNFHAGLDRRGLVYNSLA